MLIRIVDRFSKWKQQGYALFRPPRLPVSSQCCITVSPQEFSLVYARYIQGAPLLEFYGSYPYEGKEGFKTRLAALVKEYWLKKTPCSWVLSPIDYQLLQMDALPVTAAEFQAAIRWKIKDVLQFPIDDVVIDQFSLPAAKTSAKEKMIVVAAQASYLQKVSQDIKTSGLNLLRIDVPELTLRHIMGLFEEGTKSHAFLYAQESAAQLLISCEKQLYFTRNLEFGWDNAPDEMTRHIDQLASEIQRSFDYYQGQWRQTPPSSITLASTKFIPNDIIEKLSQQLSLPVERLNINDKLPSSQDINLEQQANYLPLLGELFNKEYESNATEN